MTHEHDAATTQHAVTPITNNEAGASPLILSIDATVREVRQLTDEEEYEMKGQMERGVFSRSTTLTYEKICRSDELREERIESWYEEGEEGEEA